MDNDTYDDRIPRMNDRFNTLELKFDKFLIEYKERAKEYMAKVGDDQTNIKFLNQEEFNRNIVKRLEELEDFKSQALVRLDQEIENRTNAFTKIAQLENEVEALQIWKYNIETKLERIDDILVVHRNQTDNQRKNFCALRRVLDDKVMDLLEKGEHGKQE